MANFFRRHNLPVPWDMPGGLLDEARFMVHLRTQFRYWYTMCLSSKAKFVRDALWERFNEDPRGVEVEHWKKFKSAYAAQINIANQTHAEKLAKTHELTDAQFRGPRTEMDLVELFHIFDELGIHHQLDQQSLIDLKNYYGINKSRFGLNSNDII